MTEDYLYVILERSRYGLAVRGRYHTRAEAEDRLAEIRAQSANPLPTEEIP